MEQKYNMPLIKVGEKYISGRDVINAKLWNLGYTVRVFMNCFVVYEKRK